MIDPLVRLAANATPGARHFVLLAGAGVSRDWCGQSFLDSQLPFSA